MIVVAVGCLAVAGCSRQPEPVAQVEVIAPSVDWLTIETIDMTATQKAQQELAAAATNALASELLGELEAALASGGGPAGIQACREKAPEIAARVSQQFGLKIGRTSHRLRSPNNTPPAWAERPDRQPGRGADLSGRVGRPARGAAADPAQGRVPDVPRAGRGDRRGHPASDRHLLPERPGGRLRRG